MVYLLCRLVNVIVCILLVLCGVLWKLGLVKVK